MSTERDDRIVERGAWGTVEYARTMAGELPAKDWISAAALEKRSKFDHLFRKMASTGRISNKELFRKLRGDVWEFKRGPDRLLCFRMGQRWLLTHHYSKQGSKCPPKQMDRAERIMQEHIAFEMDENRHHG